MKITGKFIQDLDYLSHTHDKGERVYDTFEVDGETIADCFKKIIRIDEQYRYCNDIRLRFDDEENIRPKYCNWIANDMTIADYYGTSIVD